MKYLFKIIIVTLLVGSISGCSELVEIEERGFVVGAAYDIVKEKQSNPIMKGTYQVVLPHVAQQGGQGDGDSGNFINVSAKADSVFEQIRIIAKKISRTLFFPHIQVIIFSEELLSNPYILQNTLDVYIRDHEMRRNIRLFVTEENAEAVLNQSAKPENLPAQYIDMLAEHPPKNAQMVGAARIGDVQEKIISKRSFVLPILKLTEQGIQMGGAALFRGKDNKYIGTLSGEQTMGINYIIGRKIGGFFTIRKKNQLITYEIHKLHRKIKIFTENTLKPKFDIHLSLEGTLAELHFNDHKRGLNEKRLEKDISREMEKRIQKSIKLVQKKYKVDVLELGEVYKRHNYKEWKKISKNWDQGKNYFSDAEITVHVHPTIEHSGSALPKRVK
ncbi:MULTISPECIES: Ger(x)C family spore germination protein [Bacillus cereus group]|uniref:Spore germination protein GerLC n=3 Tax=Bacillus cereus group TaxID=86661 RepID=A1BZF5_BACCE|nr:MULTISPECIES: Ger(x)C family spore germination protein [Bacillus cereus group]ABK00858.1 spore germination protein GerLC [Bacillus cereus]ABK01123.1 spore germination protein GerLC [Bacillus cereus]ACK92931.1 spore germination protein GerLC [Bacillus cereus AH820]MDA1640785.1 Ger(x)C family spore germination protein [Bacillus cereus group sp. TH177-1LC]MDK7541304.1 Ger(x)C family spore germination protein [Bacillus paranthracis]